MTDPLEPEEFEATVRSFEQAWQGESPPGIGEFVPASLSPGDRLRLLCELVCLDLEYRWRPSPTSGRPARFLVEDYLDRFPELGRWREQTLELIGEEYRARHRAGDAPQHAEFLARFREQREAIALLLPQLDKELAAEQDEAAPRIETIIATASGRTYDPRAPLPYADYLLQRLIGAGRMGKVYLARQRSLDRRVAVKYLRKAFLNDPHAIGRFLNEARTVARFQHPHIVGVHGLGRTPAGGYFLAMDWIDGPDLAKILERERPSLSQAVRWTIAACEAIEEAHRHGVIHCDLKPANLLLAPGERIRVTDFGLARSLADDTRTEDGIAGTAPFMAPEQVSAWWGPTSPQTDVYGLGAVLYTLLTGRPPWTGRTLPDVLAAVVSATPVRSPAALRCDLPSALVQTCQQALSKPPAERFADVAKLRQALEATLAGCASGGS
ncbi:serine/threonine-protein kinase [Lignipirellula cremea]|uniref:Serine/threonine-protein kinase PknB n=1 Tax=Lignipirellula cremea TaxID=2528010 RepID=A0A518DTJ0_9BACT|nr:serine/threonine-protein kinase [Lignipirellula cremea]QDU95159.1 Serine/threonine-protein kinase PknB [Lignipirellula cremea]